MGRGVPFAEARDRAVTLLDDRDRRLAHELAAGVLRQRAELDRALDLSRADPRLHDILRLGAYQLRWLTRVPAHAAVSTSVELARETAGEAASGYVNQALRRLEAPREAGGGEGDGVPTHPDWLTRRWSARFGAAALDRLIAWNDSRPPLTLQPARWGRERIERSLGNAGVAVETAPYDAGLRVDTREAGRPAELPGFADGGFIVQDAAAQLVCRFAGVSPGTRCYDACAAPGGKAVGLERLGARVVAGDPRRDRLVRLLETARRAGVAIQVLCADLLSAPFPNDSWDVVVVDAPCTATGTMARHPDARWRITPEAIGRAAHRQRLLLAAAALLVRPGGTLVYATCSLEPEENEGIVEDFLKRQGAFGRASASGAVPEALLTSSGDLQTLPQRDGIDGAYSARLQRAGA